MKAVLRKKTCTLPALITLLTIGVFGLIASYAFAADPVSGIDESAFLDPFSLTVYNPDFVLRLKSYNHIIHQEYDDRTFRM